MKSFLISLLAASVCLAQNAGSAAHQADLDSFEYVWKTVGDKHWDPQLGGLDWQAVHDQFRPKIEKSENIEQTRQILTEMLETLKLSHYRIIPGAVYSDLAEGHQRCH